MAKRFCDFRSSIVWAQGACWCRRAGALLFLGMMLLCSLADAATTTLRGSITAEAEASASSSPGVVGVQFEIRPGTYPVIVTVYPGTPAARQGLQAGDMLLAVDGRDVLGMTASAVDIAISDVPGTPVTFTLFRHGQRLQTRLVVAPVETVSSAPTQRLYRQLWPE